MLLLPPEIQCKAHTYSKLHYPVLLQGRWDLISCSGITNVKFHLISIANAIVLAPGERHDASTISHQPSLTVTCYIDYGPAELDLHYLR